MPIPKQLVENLLSFSLFAASSMRSNRYFQCSASTNSLKKKCGQNLANFYIRKGLPGSRVSEGSEGEGRKDEVLPGRSDGRSLRWQDQCFGFYF